MPCEVLDKSARTICHRVASRRATNGIDRTITVSPIVSSVRPRNEAMMKPINPTPRERYGAAQSGSEAHLVVEVSVACRFVATNASTREIIRVRKPAYFEILVGPRPILFQCLRARSAARNYTRSLRLTHTILQPISRLPIPALHGMVEFHLRKDTSMLRACIVASHVGNLRFSSMTARPRRWLPTTIRTIEPMSALCLCL